MIPELRKKYNSEFSEEKYVQFINDLNASKIYPVDFRVSETPLFLSEDLTKKLVQAAEEIVSQLQTDEFKKKSEKAIPAGLTVPNEDDHPIFLQIDFAICKDENGFAPRLIELQGFPSLYCFQIFLEEKYREHFSIPDNVTTYFNGLNKNSYLQLLKDTILKDTEPENVVLLEIEPEKQKTRIDFACTKDMLGINSVNLSSIAKKGKKLFYKKDKKEIPIKRIYNRVIYDELKRKNIQSNFNFTDELDVEWVGHPNWFFKISKHSLPFLKSEFVPPCYFMDDLDKYPDDLENYVLKPLYSFAGLGVEVDVTPKLLDKISDKSNLPAVRQGYILQKKIEYAPLIKTPDGYSKAEIRMMFLWPARRSLSEGGRDKPMLVNNLVRMSKGKMMGVAFNKDKTWVGSSLAYHF